MIDVTSVLLATFGLVAIIGLAFVWGFWNARAEASARDKREAVRRVERLSAPMPTPRQRARAALAELRRRRMRDD